MLAASEDVLSTPEFTDLDRGSPGAHHLAPRRAPIALLDKHQAHTSTVADSTTQPPTPPAALTMACPAWTPPDDGQNPHVSTLTINGRPTPRHEQSPTPRHEQPPRHVSRSHGMTLCIFLAACLPIRSPLPVPRQPAGCHRAGWPRCEWKVTSNLGVFLVHKQCSALGECQGSAGPPRRAGPPFG